MVAVQRRSLVRVDVIYVSAIVMFVLSEVTARALRACDAMMAG